MLKIVKPFARPLAAIALLGGNLFASAADAYEVAPMRVTLVPSSGQRGSSISVNNNEQRPLQVEIKVLRRTVSEDGTQTLSPADEDFTVFPPQMEVPAGKSQSVRFQYIGPPIAENSQAYVVQVVELPVTTPGFSGVRFTYNFGVAVYLDPPRANEKVVVVSAERNEAGIHLKLHNEGTRFSVVSFKRMSIESGTEKVELTPELLSERIANPLVPPGADRIMDIAVPEWKDKASKAPVTVKLLDPNG